LDFRLAGVFEVAGAFGLEARSEDAGDDVERLRGAVSQRQWRRRSLVRAEIVENEDVVERMGAAATRSRK